VIARDAGVTVVEWRRKLEIAAPARIGEEVRLGLRPEDVTLLLATKSRALERPQLSARNDRARDALDPGDPDRRRCRLPVVAT